MHQEQSTGRRTGCHGCRRVHGLVMHLMLAASCLVSLAATIDPQPAYGQGAALADDIIILSKGMREQEKARDSTHLGPSPGAGGNPFRYQAGTRESLLEEGTAPGGMGYSTITRNRDILSAASGRTELRMVERNLVPTEAIPPPTFPLYGPLDLPPDDAPGPENGLTYDEAIERLVRDNLDLRTKFYEIPQARADILTAGLRANPLVFGSAGAVPYGRYTPARPGENEYAATLIQAIDVNQKRKVRMDVARRALHVLEAQYQDAVRIEIDNLGAAYVEVVSARETLRYAEASVTGLRDLVRLAETQKKGGNLSLPDLNRLAMQLESAELAVEQSKLGLLQVKHGLAERLNLPPEQVEGLELRASVRHQPVELPPRDDLVALALSARPDLAAFRLGVQRAQADVRLARAERFPDIFVLYSPYEYRNNVPTGGQSATSWSLGGMASIPLFNRNQGNIQRAAINVTQSQVEMAARERQVITEVNQALTEYQASLSVVERIEKGILPKARSVRDLTFRLFRGGEAGFSEFLTAQKDYNEVVRQYRDAVIRHQRSGLRVNTTVAERLVP